MFQNVTTLFCYDFDVREPTLIVFGRNVTEEARSQNSNGCGQTVAHLSNC